MTKRFHTTASGHRIEYEASPKAVAFLRRLEEMVGDDSITTQEMTGLAYSTENPILDHAMFPGRGAVTRAVLDDPAYGVVTDLLFRKQLAEDGTDIERVAAKYSMTVGEAAAELGVTEGAIRQAIAAKRLASWVKEGGRHYVDPRAAKTLEVGTRAPVGPRKGSFGDAPEVMAKHRRVADAIAPSGAPLEVRMGSAAGASLSVRAKHPIKVDEQIGNVNHGHVSPWRRVVVKTTGEGGKTRAWVLVPGSEDNQIAHDEFFVRGRFTIAMSTNNPRSAIEMWKSTEPE